MIRALVKRSISRDLLPSSRCTYSIDSLLLNNVVSNSTTRASTNTSVCTSPRTSTSTTVFGFYQQQLQTNNITRRIVSMSMDGMQEMESPVSNRLRFLSSTAGGGTSNTSPSSSSSFPSTSSLSPGSSVPKRYRRDWKTYPMKYDQQGLQSMKYDQQGLQQFYPPGSNNNNNNSNMNQQQQQQHHIVQHSEYMIPVYAIHIAQSIDLIPATIGGVIDKVSYRKKLYGSRNFSYCVIELDNAKNNKVSSLSNVSDVTDTSSSRESRIGNTSNNYNSNDDRITESASDTTHPSFIAVYPFGSVVFFNVSPSDHTKYITYFKKHSAEKIFPGNERTEKYNVLVHDDTIVYNDDDDINDIDSSLLPSSSYDQQQLQQQQQQQQQQETMTTATTVTRQEVTPDYCIVQKELNMDGVAVISTVMAQTVALDTYNDTVDELLTKFASINSTVKKTGKFTSHDRHFLFKTVATNNSIFIDMISKTRIKDRNDAAWALTEYSTIHHRLKDEFEIEDRFESIDFKLNLIQQNAKFFMEVLHYENSNKLEWVIVVLIAVECCLMVTDMSGNGPIVFGYINSIIESIFPPTTPSIATIPAMESTFANTLADALADPGSNSNDIGNIVNDAAIHTTGTSKAPWLR